MGYILCQNCDYEILNDENELIYYIASLQKRYDRNLYFSYTINNIDLNDINKIFNYYIKILMKSLIGILLIVYFK